GAGGDAARSDLRLEVPRGDAVAGAALPGDGLLRTGLRLRIPLPLARTYALRLRARRAPRRPDRPFRRAPRPTGRPDRRPDRNGRGHGRGSRALLSHDHLATCNDL